ncbi:hypothetical protein [Methanogenium cariaci]|uniref:hypothetical protein n=1 Tax=Methanogenium cariaci TaxID=2197 RepID=UPI00155DAB58|nr:hypothetical protein [Methanogenium cariaci]
MASTSGEDACRTATAAAADANLSDRLEFACGDAATALLPEGADLVIALGSVDCWGGGPDEAIRGCAELAGENGSFLFGDRVWEGSRTPP